MNVTELAREVAEMREAQKRYFRTRGAGDLERSKAMERNLDKIVAGLLRQPGLFDRVEEMQGDSVL